jgi:mercuric ion transport protein
MACRHFPHVGTSGFAARLRKAKQRTHFVKREAQVAGTANEDQPPQIRRTIAAIAPRAIRHWQQTDALIIADRFNVPACSTGKLAIGIPVCVTCCGLPFLLATAGLGTAWLTSFALLAAPHRAILLLVGAASLGGGAVLFWRQQRIAVCAPSAFCSRTPVKIMTLAGLLVGGFLLYLGYAYA